MKVKIEKIFAPFWKNTTQKEEENRGGDFQWGKEKKRKSIEIKILLHFYFKRANSGFFCLPLMPKNIQFTPSVLTRVFIYDKILMLKNPLLFYHGFLAKKTP